MPELSQPPWPAQLRARARSCHRALLALRHQLLALCPDATALADDPSLAERIDSTPHDLDAAATLTAIAPLLDALANIA